MPPIGAEDRMGLGLTLPLGTGAVRDGETRGLLSLFSASDWVPLTLPCVEPAGVEILAL